MKPVQFALASYFAHLPATVKANAVLNVYFFKTCFQLNFEIIGRGHLDFDCTIVKNGKSAYKGYQRYGKYFFSQFSQDIAARSLNLYSLHCPFLCFTTNQFAQKFKFLANRITYYVNMYNIYGVRVNH